MRLVWLIFMALAAALAVFLWTRFESDAPKIRTRTSLGYVSEEYRHQFRISDEGMGLQSVRTRLESGGKTYELSDETYPGSLLTGADPKIQRRVDVVIKPAELGVADGPATLHLETRDYSWGGNSAQVAVSLLIDTKAPRVQLQTGLTYVRRGGTELVVYKIDEEVDEDGVVLGDHFFPGFAHPAEPDRRVAFYALPPSTPAGSVPPLTAVDRAGNRVTVPMRIEVIERSFPVDEIALSDDFMARKVAELGAAGEGTTLDVYLAINRDMRAENAATIAKLTEASSEDRLWNESFQGLKNPSRKARFGESRTYTYGGRTVDKQVHLGVDLASTSLAPVPAGNDGVVAFADDLGIYGNTVIVDHGLGLFSLYGHLSDIGVEMGQVVTKGEEIGHTGSTGLAGGDHLHFSMLVHGVFVDPMEWFDARWISEHIEPKLSPSQS